MSYIDGLLSSNESILAQQRKHWIALASTVWGLFWSFFWLVVLYRVFARLTEPTTVARLAEVYPPYEELQQLLVQLPPWFIPSVIGLLALLYLLGFVRGVLSWLNDIDIITTRRVIQVRGAISKVVIDSSLEKINDVLLQQSWLGRLLGYGHLVILTASETGLNHMAHLANPLEFKRIMLDAKQGTMGSGGSVPSGRGNVAERLAQLEQLRQQGLIAAPEYEAKRQQLLDEV